MILLIIIAAFGFGFILYKIATEDNRPKKKVIEKDRVDDLEDELIKMKTPIKFEKGDKVIIKGGYDTLDGAYGPRKGVIVGDVEQTVSEHRQGRGCTNYYKVVVNNDIQEIWEQSLTINKKKK